MAAKRSLRIASYNVRKCIGLDRRRRPERILGILNEIEADVAVLQEADRRLGERRSAIPIRLIESETDFEPVALGQGPSSLGWHGNAVLVRRGVPHGQPRQIDLPGTEPRGAVAVEVNGITVVGVHLGLMRSDRRRQLSTLVDALPKTPIAIAGDFNEWRPKRGLEPLAGFAIHAPGRSFHAVRPVAALDRIALCPALELADAGVVENGAARIASDHLPVWADVRPA